LGDYKTPAEERVKEMRWMSFARGCIKIGVASAARVPDLVAGALLLSSL